MLLEELFAKDIDLSEYEKKLMVNIFNNGELNIKDLYSLEDNQSNLRGAQKSLLRNKFIEETNQRDFYRVTDSGKESMNRAALIDDNNKLIDAHTSKYFYDEKIRDDDEL